MLLVLVGHSGTGKTTLRNILVEKYGFKKPLEYTTRKIRKNEQEEYNFVSHDSFQKMQMDNYLNESIMYGGKLYGIHLNSDILKNEKQVVIAIPDGYEQFKNYCYKYGIKCISVHLKSSDNEDRMRKRGDSEEDIQKRISMDNWDFKGDLEYNNWYTEETAEDIMLYINGQ